MGAYTALRPTDPRLRGSSSVTFTEAEESDEAEEEDSDSEESEEAVEKAG